MELSLSDVSAVKLSLVSKGASGAVLGNVGSAKWISSDPTNLDVVVSPDTYSCSLVAPAGAVPASLTISVGLSTPDGRTLSASLPINLTAEMIASIDISVL